MTCNSIYESIKLLYPSKYLDKNKHISDNDYVFAEIFKSLTVNKKAHIFCIYK